MLMYHTYRMAEATNWTKVHTAVGMQMLALTRDYERRFGIPSGTNSFAQRFPQIQTAVAQFERQLVPLSAAFTNLPRAGLQGWRREEAMSEPPPDKLDA